MRVLGEWLLTPFRAAVHEPTRTAVIADLHLGYSEARRRAGEAVPLLTMRQILAPLRHLAAAREVEGLVVAGDLFEVAYRDDLWAEFLRELDQLRLNLRAVVPGNHDRKVSQASPPVPLFPDGFSLGGYRVLHGDGPLPEGPLLLGHFHPSVRWQGRKLPCYLVGARHLILPAFSLDAAGASFRHIPLTQPFGCYAICEGRVLDLGTLRNSSPGTKLPRKRQKGRGHP